MLFLIFICPISALVFSLLFQYLFLILMPLSFLFPHPRFIHCRARVRNRYRSVNRHGSEIAANPHFY